MEKKEEGMQVDAGKGFAHEKQHEILRGRQRIAQATVPSKIQVQPGMIYLPTLSALMVRLFQGVWALYKDYPNPCRSRL